MNVLEYAGREVDAPSAFQPHFAFSFYLPSSSYIEQSLFDELHVVVAIDEHVFEAYLSVEDLESVQMLYCVDERYKDLPHYDS